MDFTLDSPLTGSDPALAAAADDNNALAIFLIETDHMTSPGYVESLRLGGPEASVRRDTVSLILQLSCALDPSLSYLAVNYLDRFLSSHHSLEPKPWILQLLAVSCMALASKMLRTETPLATLRGDNGGFIPEASTIQRMETVILTALKWRMRSITPFSFVPFFILRLKLEDSSSTRALKDRVMEIILKAQHDVRLLEFKPSLNAASAVLIAAQELFPSRYRGFEEDVLSCSFVNKDELSACLEAMQVLASQGYESGVEDQDSSAGTPTTVLGHRHFSCSDSETANEETESAPTKRRKTQ
ncbi:hypothetical protein MLD38_025826 [Melastoma candidum]|uniref:Uncharacterized protein n=1 Tax=Melastoma candidum TaxID=119954 RepID=A0ACB9NWI7_9MYRT|nr:hypothetical protein MLD38_025826 [Melastoma candidum]